MNSQAIVVITQQRVRVDHGRIGVKGLARASRAYLGCVECRGAAPCVVPRWLL